MQGSWLVWCAATMTSDLYRPRFTLSRSSVALVTTCISCECFQGPPPDPAYNYLADHERDKPIGEKMRRGPRGHLNPRNNVVRGNRPRNDQVT